MSTPEPPPDRTDLFSKILDAVREWLKTVDPRYGAACTFCGFLLFAYLGIAHKDPDHIPWALGFLGVSVGQWGAHVKRQQAAADQAALIADLQRQLTQAQEALAAQLKRNTDITVTAAASSQQAATAIATAVGAPPPPPPPDSAIRREIAKQVRESLP